jgi:hypothetical protein
MNAGILEAGSYCTANGFLGQFSVQVGSGILTSGVGHDD